MSSSENCRSNKNVTAGSRRKTSALFSLSETLVTVLISQWLRFYRGSRRRHVSLLVLAGLSAHLLTPFKLVLLLLLVKKGVQCDHIHDIQRGQGK